MSNFWYSSIWSFRVLSRCCWFSLRWGCIFWSEWDVGHRNLCGRQVVAFLDHLGRPYGPKSFYCGGGREVAGELPACARWRSRSSFFHKVEQLSFFFSPFWADFCWLGAHIGISFVLFAWQGDVDNRCCISDDYRFAIVAQWDSGCIKASI